MRYELDAASSTVHDKSSCTHERIYCNMNKTECGEYTYFHINDKYGHHGRKLEQVQRK